MNRPSNRNDDDDDDDDDDVNVDDDDDEDDDAFNIYDTSYDLLDNFDDSPDKLDD